MLAILAGLFWHFSGIVAWINYLASQATSLLARAMVLNSHLLFSSSRTHYRAREPICVAAFSQPRFLLFESERALVATARNI